MELLKLKKEIHANCIQILNEKIDSIKKQIFELNQSFADEGKNSAGDKHETARAMAQLEVEKLHQQLHLFETQIGIIKKLNPDSSSNTIQNGSLIKTDKGNFYIAVPLGKVENVMVISAGAPLGKELIGKKVEEVVIFNKTKYKIEIIC